MSHHNSNSGSPADVFARLRRKGHRPDLPLNTLDSQDTPCTTSAVGTSPRLSLRRAPSTPDIFDVSSILAKGDTDRSKDNNGPSNTRGTPPTLAMRSTISGKATPIISGNNSTPIRIPGNNATSTIISGNDIPPIVYSRRTIHGDPHTPIIQKECRIVPMYNWGIRLLQMRDRMHHAATHHPARIAISPDSIEIFARDRSTPVTHECIIPCDCVVHASVSISAFECILDFFLSDLPQSLRLLMQYGDNEFPTPLRVALHPTSSLERVTLRESLIAAFGNRIYSCRRAPAFSDHFKNDNNVKRPRILPNEDYDSHVRIITDPAVVVHNNSPNAQRPGDHASPTHNAVVSSHTLLFRYPFGTTDAVAITNGDLACLPEGVYLNDSIIDFDLKRTLAAANERWMASGLSHRVHIYSSFFYSRLAAAKHSQRPATSVDIFEKDMVLVPICESQHWFLALLWNPAHVLCESDASAGDIIASTPDNANDPIDVSSGEDNNIDDRNPTTTIVIFDSLGSRSRRAAIERMRVFLEDEALTKYGIQLCRRSIPAIYARVPLQPNLTDCGCFLLEYVERLLADPIGITRHIFQREDLSAWFPPEDATLRRLHIRLRIETLQEQYANMYGKAHCEMSAQSSDIEEVSEADYLSARNVTG